MAVRFTRPTVPTTAAFTFVLLVLLGASPPSDAAEPARVRYRPPVDGVIVDPFRPPEHRFGPGNRGIDYAVAPLTPVRAAADGEVIFAGPVAGTLHVTIRHADGLRSTYSFLADIAVAVGDHVVAGAVVGRSQEIFHFGVRDPDGNYLDPALLFSATGRARLVPGGDDGTSRGDAPESAPIEALVAERAGAVEALLARAVAGGGAVGVPLPTLAERTRLWAHLLAETAPSAGPPPRLVAGLVRWVGERSGCTPPGQVPPAPSGRRILIEVGGIGSTSEHAAVDRVDTTALGYAAPDVVRFSYAGGRVPAAPGPGAGRGTGPLSGLPSSSYTAVDSQEDLHDAAARLGHLLADVAAAEPGVPIDVVAHSQGGVVARLALDGADRSHRLPPTIRTLVTLASPNQGADVAAVVQAGRLTGSGRRALASLRTRLGIDLDPDLPASAQLVPTSPVMDELRAMAPPPGVRVVSVGARGDVVVPAHRTAIAGVPSTVVDVAGPRAHDRLPSSPQATREIALAIAGRGPTCRSAADAVTDLVVAERIGRAEAGLGLVLATATSWGDALGPDHILWRPAPAGVRCWPDLASTQYTRPLARRMPGRFTTTSSPGSTHGHGPPVGSSRRPPVSSNRGKETTRWHLSSRCGSSLKLASISATRPGAGTPR